MNKIYYSLSSYSDQLNRVFTTNDTRFEAADELEASQLFFPPALRADGATGAPVLLDLQQYSCNLVIITRKRKICATESCILIGCANAISENLMRFSDKEFSERRGG